MASRSLTSARQQELAQMNPVDLLDALRVRAQAIREKRPDGYGEVRSARNYDDCVVVPWIREYRLLRRAYCICEEVNSAWLVSWALKEVIAARNDLLLAIKERIDDNRV